MKLENLTLEDLSRDELLRLMRLHYLEPRESDLLQVRRETMRLKAKKMAEEADQEMAENMGNDLARLKKYVQAMRKAERAHRLYRKIQASYDREPGGSRYSKKSLEGMQSLTAEGSENVATLNVATCRY